MLRGRILVVDGDEWLAQVLAKFLGERSFTVEVCLDAQSGFQKAREMVPDCVVCAITLPDIDGFWVARRIRTEVGPVSRVPFILLADAADKEAQVQGLHVGADVILERPVANDVIVAQIEALVSMARRHRTDPPEDHLAPPLAAAFKGDLANFPLATVLMMLEMERRTGTLEVTSTADQRAVFGVSNGQFASSEVEGTKEDPVAALRTVMAWSTGRFTFRPRAVTSLPPPGGGTVGAAVLEATRLEDERNAPPKQS